MEIDDGNYKGLRQVFEKELRRELIIGHDVNFNYEMRSTYQMISVLNLSQHAVLRMAQWNISLNDLKYALEHGERVHKTGVAFYILRKRDIPRDDRKRSEIMRLEGTVVLIAFLEDRNPEIITIYRHRGAFRFVQCKAKYSNKRNIERTGIFHTADSFSTLSFPYN